MDDIDILSPYVLQDLYIDFAVAKRVHQSLTDTAAQIPSDLLSQIGIGIPGKDCKIFYTHRRHSLFII